MCECGCSIGNPCYRLKAPSGWYVLEMYPGCKDCGTPPGVVVHKVGKDSFYYDNIKDIPDLPFRGEEPIECPIVCGLSPSEMRKAVADELDGTEMDGESKIDRILAEQIGEDLWDSVHRRPSVVT